MVPLGLRFGFDNFQVWLAVEEFLEHLDGSADAQKGFAQARLLRFQIGRPSLSGLKLLFQGVSILSCIWSFMSTFGLVFSSQAGRIGGSYVGERQVAEIHEYRRIEMKYKAQREG